MRRRRLDERRGAERVDARQHEGRGRPRSTRRRRSATPNGAADRSDDASAPCGPRARGLAHRRELDPLPGRQFEHEHARVGSRNGSRDDQRGPHPPRAVRDGRRRRDASSPWSTSLRRATLDLDAAQHPPRQQRGRRATAPSSRAASTNSQPACTFVPIDEQDGRAEQRGRPRACAGARSAPSRRLPSGTGTSSRTRRTTSRPTPAPAPGLPRASSRCASTAGASAFTSSGSTKSRPSAIARACAHRVERDHRARRRAERDLGRRARRLHDARRRSRRSRRPRGPRGRRAGAATTSSGVSTASRSSIGCARSWRRTISAAAALVRVADRDRQREPVELPLGQRIRAVLLDRVLGRDHEERRGQRVRHALDRHLPLLHRLQQRRLRPRRRAVDLVDQHDVGEDRAGHEPELVPCPGRRR